MMHDFAQKQGLHDQKVILSETNGQDFEAIVKMNGLIWVGGLHFRRIKIHNFSLSLSLRALQQCIFHCPVTTEW